MSAGRCVSPEAWVAFLREFGLPLSMLALGAVALYRRWIVTGSDHQRKVDLLTAEVEYREARRIEERLSRVAAEERLAKLTNTLPRLADALAKREQDLEALMESGRDERAILDRLVSSIDKLDRDRG
jgi:hypothetical protein